MPALPQMAKTGLPFSCAYDGLSVTLISFNYIKVVRAWTLKDVTVRTRCSKSSLRYFSTSSPLTPDTSYMMVH